MNKKIYTNSLTTLFEGFNGIILLELCRQTIWIQPANKIETYEIATLASQYNKY